MEADSNLGGADVLTVSGTGGFIFRIDSIKFGTSTQSADPNMWFNIYDINELMLTDMEFRDCQSWGAKITNAGSWNYADGSHFLGNSGVFFDGATDVRFVDCKINGDCRVDDVTNVSVAGNEGAASIVRKT
jgi:hypothetical protein